MNPERKAQAQSNFVHQLRDLHNLLEIGAIDTTDYDVQKKRILDELNSFMRQYMKSFGLWISEVHI
eukprot:m.278778 g.278778  ORF g.278778 m.278778 type:complete len:66 (+) comp40612_c0_seq6:327-524(+)